MNSSFSVSRTLMVTALVLFVAVLLSSYASSQNNYQSKSAEQKYEQLWGLIKSAPNASPWPSTWALAKLFFEDMNVSFQLADDFFPTDRTKLIHSVGVIAGIKFVPEPTSKYTGIFQGSSQAFARCSTGAQPDFTKSDATDGGFNPGCSFKFLRNGVPSANVFALAALKPVDSWNFFKHPLSNHLSLQGFSFALSLILNTFKKASTWPGNVGLSDVAARGEDGVAVKQINFPFQILFSPNADLQKAFPDTFQTPYTEQLKTLAPGTLLYEVMAKDSHKAPLVKIGSIVLTTQFVSSSFADQGMFFQHQRFEDDIKLRPEFTQDCPSQDNCPACPIDLAC